MSKTPKEEFKEVVMNAVEYFEQRTGVTVESIKFHREDLRAIGQEDKSIIHWVQLELK